VELKKKKKKKNQEDRFCRHVFRFFLSLVENYELISRHFKLCFLPDATKSHMVYGCRVSSSPFFVDSWLFQRVRAEFHHHPFFVDSWSFLLFDNSIQVSEFSSFLFQCLSDGFANVWAIEFVGGTTF
jgi:hypothetical protein